MDLVELGTDGPQAPPRENGELTFTAPWESRSFAMVLALAEQGLFTLDEFREHLIAAIARWEASGSDEPYQYYERWQEALESITDRQGLVSTGALDERAKAFALRPPGHDHDHDGHDHSHDHSH